MKLSMNRFDYFQRMNPNVEIIEDNYGQITINDYSKVSDMPCVSLLKENIFDFLPNKLRGKLFLIKRDSKV